MSEVGRNPLDAEFWTGVLNHKFHGKGQKWRQEELDGVLGDSQVCELNLFYRSESSDVPGLYRHAHSRTHARVDRRISGREDNHHNA